MERSIGRIICDASSFRYCARERVAVRHVVADGCGYAVQVNGCAADGNGRLVGFCESTGDVNGSFVEGNERTVGFYEPSVEGNELFVEFYRPSGEGNEPVVEGNGKSVAPGRPFLASETEFLEIGFLRSSGKAKSGPA